MQNLTNPTANTNSTTNATSTNFTTENIKDHTPFNDSTFSQTLKNICYSWRYKGYCRYSSECRYIHENLDSISVLYHIDDPKYISNVSSHYRQYDQTHSMTEVQTDTVSFSFSILTFFLLNNHHNIIV